MCLARIYSDDEMAEYLEGQPEVIEVWKIVKYQQGCFEPAIREGLYKDGFNTTKSQKISVSNNRTYWSGYHFFTSRPDDEKCAQQRIVVIKCLVKKEWISAIGVQRWGDVPDIDVIIVSPQAIFPHYPEIEARYEDLPKEEKQELEAAAKK